MQVIRQDHDGVDREWPLLPRHAKCGVQRADLIGKSGRSSIDQCQREEEFSAGGPFSTFSTVSTQSRHTASHSVTSSGARWIAIECLSSAFSFICYVSLKYLDSVEKVGSCRGDIR
jgi:hypothetical protein